MRKVVVLGTGGTIASRASAGASAVATSGVAELLGSLHAACELEARDLMTIGSYAIGFAEMRVIAEAAAAAAREPGVAGVVVTHGTDTMEESAYLTHLLYDGEETGAPIVFTGAQFAADTISPDGSRNLLDAIAFASDEQTRGCGVGVAFGGELFAARGTRKLHTVAPNPFVGGVLIARRRGDRIAVHATPVRQEPVFVLGTGFDASVVDAVVCAPGIDTGLFQQAVDRSQAVVLVGTGVGNAGPGFAAAVAAATTAGIPVVLSTRVALGPTTPVYGNGGGVDLVQAGAVPAAELGQSQARILAAAIVSTHPQGNDPRESFADRFAASAG